MKSGSRWDSDEEENDQRRKKVIRKKEKKENEDVRMEKKRKIDGIIDVNDKNNNNNHNDVCSSRSRIDEKSEEEVDEGLFRDINVPTYKEEVESQMKGRKTSKSTSVERELVKQEQKEDFRDDNKKDIEHPQMIINQQIEEKGDKTIIGATSNEDKNGGEGSKVFLLPNHAGNSESKLENRREKEKENEILNQKQRMQREKRQENIFVPGCRNVDHWEWESRIDEGTYGVVHKAKNRATGQIVALKRVKISTEDRQREGFSICAFREINILLALRHENIVRVHEMAIGRDTSLEKLYLPESATEEQKRKERMRQKTLLSTLSVGSPISSASSQALTDLHFYMVMDYYDNDLRNTLNDLQKPFPREIVKTLMLQILHGLEYMHSHWYIHRDLKSSNLLLRSQTGKLAIADFGLARKYSNPVDPMTLNVVTREYRAPELLLGATLYDTAIDMWSVGCIFAELLLLVPLFRGKDDFDQINTIFRLRGSPTLEIWPDIVTLPQGTRFVSTKSTNSNNNNTLKQYFFDKNCIMTEEEENLLLSLLSLDPKKRITAKEALIHPYFTIEDPLPCPMENLPQLPQRQPKGSKIR